MLVLTRKASQTINIGTDVTLTVLGVSGKSVRLGIDAPKEIAILRGELCLQMEQPGVRKDASHLLPKQGLPLALMNVPASVIQVP